MSKRSENRTYNVAVVGLSGTEKEKGACGIGKSCLINRFMRPMADEYYTDHISVLSQSDFAGRVVNNDHFLYWGDATKVDDGFDFRFHVIEQTEFIDDSSFQSFRIGKTEPYFKRCSMCKLQSAEKLAYICKNQLGLEHEFEQKMLPEGRITIDGFLCLFDVSQVGHRPIERQVEYTACILLHLIKTKKPVVLVTTKNDEVYRPFVSEAERLVNRKDLKERGAIPIVETSAHENVNIELAFLTLAHMIERSNKNRPKPTPYSEAARACHEVMDVAREAFQSLVRSHVADYKTPWVLVSKKLAADSDFIHFIELFGTDQAVRLFRKHVNLLKEEFIRQKQSMYLHQLEVILHDVLPDLSTISDRGWYSMMAWMRQQDFFDRYFVVMPDDIPWKDSGFLESGEERVPFDLLEVQEAETIFRNYVNLLRAEHRKSELKRQFRQLLEDNNHICPGKSLSEVAIFFLGRECFTSLSEKDKQEIYEEHQRALKERAKRDFQELLLENAELFAKFEHVMVTNDDIVEVNQRLQQEPRYAALSRMEDDRRAILLNHLGFIQHAYRDRCCFRDQCAEVLIEQVLSLKASRPQSWNRNSQLLLDSQDNRLQFVILGSGQLAEQLACEIRAQCVDDEYMLDGELVTLGCRTLSGDVSLPNNSFKTPNFHPHACFCVYNSMLSLDYIRFSLERTLVTNMEQSLDQNLDQLSLYSIPIVLVLGHNPEATERDLVLLREEGQNFADRLQCPFVDVPSSMMVHTNRTFHEDQIGLAMHNLVVCIKQQRPNSLTAPWHLTESFEPDLRILICLMCGDSFNIDIPLAPLLNHQFCYVASDEYMSITLETFLDEAKRKVEVTLTSYHGASQMHQYLYHGYVAVYSVRRRASLSNLKAFASKISSAPVKILAVAESGATAFFANERMQSLLMEGNAFADSIKASFMTTCANFQQQIASYTPFFKKCWDRKTETEIAFTFAKDIGATGLLKVPNRSLHERMRTRPPAMLPKSLVPYTLTKSSTSNSADESDPAALEPSMNNLASDSDHNPLDSSASLQVHDNGSIYEEVYSEIGSHGDTERLIKPSLAKARRNGFADRYRKSFPGASSSVTSGYFCDVSTDTDGSVHSPKLQLQQPTSAAACPSLPIDLREPHYQFRKSNSMKLALKEDEEEFSAAEVLSDESAISNKKSGSVFAPKSLQPQRPKPLDAKKFGPVRQIIRHNMAYNCQPTMPPVSIVKAPLATPEPIEFGDYAQVKDSPLDAVFPCENAPQLENNYASVADALPVGQMHRIRSASSRVKQDLRGSESDSEYSSAEWEGSKDPWVNRKLASYKKKQHKPRRTDAFGISVSPGDDHQSLLRSDQLDKVRDYSPSEGSDGTNEELAAVQKQKKKRSLRSKKKSATLEHDVQLPWTDSDITAQQRKVSLDEEAVGRDLSGFGKVINFGGDDLGDGINWRRKLRLRSEKDAESIKQRREEKKLKEEERRRSKADKQKNKEKTQRKSKSKAPGSTSSMTLEELAKSEDSLVPLFVQRCIKYIEMEGIAVEGLYRVPGNRAHVDVFLEKFREDPQMDIGAMDFPVSVVATALKSFFSDLSNPVVPLHLYDELKDALILPDRTLRLLTIRGVLKKLPPTSFAVLKFIVTHINRVSKHSSENAMDTKNLAICWWPTLMRPEITSLDTMFLTTKPLEEVLQLLIEQFGFFFYGEEEAAS